MLLVCLIQRMVRSKVDEISDEEVDVRGSRDTHYEQRGKVPGIYVRNGRTTRNVKWTPIKP